MKISIDSLTIDIIDVLEEHGVENESYILHEYIDLDALEQLVFSNDTLIEVQTTIEGVQLSITQHGVEAFTGDGPTNE